MATHGRERAKSNTAFRKSLLFAMSVRAPADTCPIANQMSTVPTIAPSTTRKHDFVRTACQRSSSYIECLTKRVFGKSSG